MLLYFAAYQLTQALLFPFFIVYLVHRKLKSKPVFGNFWHRIGVVPRAPNGKVLWFHAVSVGEVLSLQSIIEKVKQENPKTVCYLTVGTITGAKMAHKNLAADFISFVPYDFLIPMLIAFSRIKPNRIIITEAEIWPNLLMVARLKKIPLYLINARISDRSKNKYFYLRPIIAPLLNSFEKIYTQSEKDKELFLQMSVKGEKLSVLGDIKAANVLKKIESAGGTSELESLFDRKDLILLAGSIHPGEEKIYLKLYKELKRDFPKLKLILAPRHFHWKKKLIEAAATGYKYKIWEDDMPQGEWEILLVCKLGELFKLYKHATIYFLGGTFVPIGGHNLLEPTAWKVATVVGPHHQNSLTIAKALLKKDGLVVAKNYQELLEKTRSLLEDGVAREKIADNGYSWLKNKGAIVEASINQFLKEVS